MKIRFLLKVENNEEQWIATCLSINRKSIISSTKDNAINSIKELCNIYLEDIGRKYINRWSKTDKQINCPNALIDLPIDNYKCKVDKRICSIQGAIDESHYDTFLNNCHLDNKTKEGILKAIQNKLYEGFHHVLGRQLCPLCNESNINFNYHYPWEFTSLIDFFNINESHDKRIHFRINIIKNHIDLCALSSPLCPKCFKETALIIDPNIENDLIILEFDYNRNA